MSNKFRNPIKFMWIISVEESSWWLLRKIFFCPHNLRTRTIYAFIIYKHPLPERALNIECKFFSPLWFFYISWYFLVIPSKTKDCRYNALAPPMDSMQCKIQINLIWLIDWSSYYRFSSNNNFAVSLLSVAAVAPTVITHWIKFLKHHLVHQQK